MGNAEAWRPVRFLSVEPLLGSLFPQDRVLPGKPGEASVRPDAKDGSLTQYAPTQGPTGIGERPSSKLTFVRGPRRSARRGLLDPNGIHWGIA